MKLDKYGFRKDFNPKKRLDLKTQVGDYEISTVDLGIDHSFGFGKPLYYETMIFIKADNFNDRFFSKKNIFENFQERYSTEEEAKLGHQLAIQFVKKKLEGKSE
ncbi:MAG: hypothetical protein IJB82_02330 [Bacilli bacterium]|nr:hypothetical protein [Bacilli bacterium]